MLGSRRPWRQGTRNPLIRIERTRALSARWERVWRSIRAIAGSMPCSPRRRVIGNFSEFVAALERNSTRRAGGDAIALRRPATRSQVVYRKSGKLPSSAVRRNQPPGGHAFGWNCSSTTVPVVPAGSTCNDRRNFSTAS